MSAKQPVQDYRSGACHRGLVTEGRYFNRDAFIITADEAPADIGLQSGGCQIACKSNIMPQIYYLGIEDIDQ